MKRVVHVVTTVRHGGAERVVLELARAQRSRGWVPEVICLHALGELAREFESAGIPVELVPGAERPGVFRTAQSLARLLRSRPFDVVHSHNAAAQVAVGLGVRLRWWSPAKRPLVHTEHGRLSDTRWMFLALRRWTLGVFDAIVAVSENVRAQLASHSLGSPAHRAVILNGIDVERFGASTAPADRGNDEVLHVGRLEHIKGQDVLIEAMPIVRKQCGQATLVVVGDGSTRGALEERARTLGVESGVRFVGATLDVKPFLERAAVFVLPSRSEGLSVALLEAMASALPIVATRVGGNADALGGGSCGLIVAPESAAELGSAIAALLQDRERAVALGRNARRAAAERFSLGVTVERYLALYGER